MSDYTSLTTLQIHTISGLVNLDEADIEDLVGLQNGVIGSERGRAIALQSSSFGDKYCNNLEKLANGLHQLTCLRTLKIRSCEKLMSFPARGVPYSLKDLEIDGYNALESVLEGIIISHGNHISQLRALKICGCKSLKSSPNGKFPNSLETLIIGNMHNWSAPLFESLCTILASRLTKLEIKGCPQLE
ncbi:conserved hypothetical protein [Ricinus communis]|uniref:Uncharacterized protein n=1 Tax=Ricinus communis TaxID=3988 RepID=B9SZK2_RICCO|nr:conserved hypothetical protein [Ricinus communis]